MIMEKEVFLVELVNGTTLLANVEVEQTLSEVTLMKYKDDNTVELKKPIHLLPRQSPDGSVQLALLPYVRFLPKEKQSVSSVYIQRQHVVSALSLRDTIKDGGQLEDAYNSFVSEIVTVRGNFNMGSFNNGNSFQR